MNERAWLAGCNVWLARPAGRARPWQAALESMGAEVWHEPLIRIAPPRDPTAACRALAAGVDADLVIATSASAVAGLAGLMPDWRPTGRLLAVGRATADALAERLSRPVDVPVDARSEGLLAMDALADVAGRRVAILAGEGGRDVLADTLASRGGHVTSIALYRRASAVLPAARLDSLLAECRILLLTSDGAWQALVEQCTDKQLARLSGLSLVAPSRRVVQHTQRDIGWQHLPVVIQDMTALGAMQAVTRAWRAR